MNSGVRKIDIVCNDKLNVKGIAGLARQASTIYYLTEVVQKVSFELS